MVDPNPPYERILDCLPEVVWLRDFSTGAFRYCSPAAHRVWGLDARSLMQDPALWFCRIHPDDRDGVHRAWSSCQAGGVYDVEYRIRTAGGELCWLHDHGGQLTPLASGDVCVAGLTRELSGRKNLEAEVRKAYDALHSSVNGVIITDLKGTIVYANPAFLKLFGFAGLSVALGHPYEQLFVREDIEAPGDVVNEVAHSSRLSREFLMRRKDGSRMLVEVSSSAVHDADGVVTGTMASFVDVTERKRREAQARQQHQLLVRLTERMAVLEERERRRVSTLIHDTVVQSLALANIRLGAVSKALSKAGLDQDHHQLQGARDLITEGIQRCRLVMRDLTPPLLYEVGLGAALAQFADRIQQLQGVVVEVRGSDRETSVPEALRGVLFQVARELVMNACKHAAASRIDIRFWITDGAVELQVHDDGCGFDPSILEGPQQSNAEGGFGLFSVRHRLDGRGGQLRVQSSPGHGAKFQVTLPLPPREGAPV